MTTTARSSATRCSEAGVARGGVDQSRGRVGEKINMSCLSQPWERFLQSSVEPWCGQDEAKCEDDGRRSTVRSAKSGISSDSHRRRRRVRNRTACTTTNRVPMPPSSMYAESPPTSVLVPYLCEFGAAPSRNRTEYANLCALDVHTSCAQPDPCEGKVDVGVVGVEFKSSSSGRAGRAGRRFPITLWRLPD